MLRRVYSIEATIGYCDMEEGTVNYNVPKYEISVSMQYSSAEITLKELHKLVELIEAFEARETNETRNISAS